MNVFEHQDEARRNTKLLVVLFLLAVAVIVFSVYTLFLFVFAAPSWRGILNNPGRLWEQKIFLNSLLGTLGVIGGGTFYKISALSRGGSAVADILGGTRLEPNTADPAQRRLLNIVEELAIASGMAVPEVYVLEKEAGINAFAAGHNQDDAVIGVTAGCLRHLNRDELQGVLGHEFSHILNGDMRLNLRLMGVLYGILIIALIGRGILRGTSRSRSRKKGGGGALLGLGLLIVGYAGVFFGRLIKSAVSREREYLGDASAVQFTRNPTGLAGALKKIGGLSTGSIIESPKAAEASHLFFSGALRGFMSNAFSTHPPLADRIRRLDPAWDGSYPPVTAVRLPGPEETARDRKRVVAAPRLAADPDSVAAAAGAPTGGHLELAAEHLAALPEEIAEAAREPWSARAVVFAMLLDEKAEVGAAQLEHLEKSVEPKLLERTARLKRHFHGRDPVSRLDLMDLSLPALRRLSPPQFEDFRKAVAALSAADDRESPFEAALAAIVERKLAPAYRGAMKPARAPILRDLEEPCSILLSAIARAGAKDEEGVGSAFLRGGDELENIGVRVSMTPSARTGVAGALAALAAASEREKAFVVRSLAAAASHDGEIDAGEADLLRTFSAGMGVPLPPLLSAQSPGIERKGPSLPITIPAQPVAVWASFFLMTLFGFFAIFPTPLPYRVAFGVCSALMGLNFMATGYAYLTGKAWMIIDDEGIRDYRLLTALSGSRFIPWEEIGTATLTERRIEQTNFEEIVFFMRSGKKIKLPVNHLTLPAEEILEVIRRKIA